MNIQERIEAANNSREEHFKWVYQGGVPIWERATVQRRVAMAAWDWNNGKVVK